MATAVLARSQALRSGDFGPQLAGLDHDAAILQGHIGQRVDSASKTARARAHPNGAAAAEHRDRHGLVDQPGWFGGQLVAIQPHQRKGIVGIVDSGGDQRVSAFADQAGIRAVKQDYGAAGIGPGEKSVDVFSAERDQRDQVPA